jgi:hypothetical protein
MRITFITLIAAACLCLQGQTPPAKEAAPETKGMPPRATPADYQAHMAAGSVTIAAEFTAHSITTVQGALTTEDYVVVEVGLFGEAGARTKVSDGDFTLRINGKKWLTTQPFGLVIGNVKDPEWEPPTPPKSKTSLGGSGGGDQKDPNSGPPPPVHVPFEVQRALSQRVLKMALPEGDRALPTAGLIFFRYGGQAKGIHEVELMYAGAAGKARLRLHP